MSYKLKNILKLLKNGFGSVFEIKSNYKSVIQWSLWNRENSNEVYDYIYALIHLYRNYISIIHKTRTTEFNRRLESHAASPCA